MFDGSSIAGWKGINESDMILLPDASTARIDPFKESTLIDLRYRRAGHREGALLPTARHGQTRRSLSEIDRPGGYRLRVRNEFSYLYDVRYGRKSTAHLYSIDSSEAA